MSETAAVYRLILYIYKYIYIYIYIHLYIYIIKLYLLAFTGKFSYTYNIRNYKKLYKKFQKSKFIEFLTQGLSTKYLKYHLVTFDLLNNNFFYSQVVCNNI